MDNIKRLERILEEKKWIRNDIGMGRIQCSKLMCLNDELILIITSEVNDKPVWARVEKILLVNDEIILFYDGEYSEELEEEEYSDYKGYISREEWSTIFKDNSTTELEKNNFVSCTDGFYVEVHESIKNYEDEFDKEESAKLNQHFNL